MRRKKKLKLEEIPTLELESTAMSSGDEIVIDDPNVNYGCYPNNCPPWTSPDSWC